MIRFVIGAGGKDPFLPHNFRAMDQRLVAPADGVVVDKRQVHYIQLVFNASGIMSVPVVFDLTVREGLVDFPVKERQIRWCLFRISVPEIDDAVVFSHRVMSEIVAAEVRPGRFSVGRNEPALALRIKPQTMKRTLDTVILDLPQTQRRSPMRALVHNTAQFPCFTSEHSQFQIQPPDSDDLSRFDFFGWKYGIPLIGDHYTHLPNSLSLPYWIHFHYSCQLIPMPVSRITRSQLICVIFKTPSYT